MTQNLLYLLLGLIAGTFSGLIGIGGGTIIVPALIFLFGMSQHLAQGTTLALLVPPIGFLAAWTYYKQGYSSPLNFLKTKKLHDRKHQGLPIAETRESKETIFSNIKYRQYPFCLSS